MNLVQQLQEQKDKIIEDMMSPITYKPHRLNDISAMMNRYKSTEVDFKEQMEILENLGNCINHKPYEQPYGVVRDYYTESDVVCVANTLNDFIDRVSESLDIEADCATLRETLAEINMTKNGVIMDSWRLEKVDELMEMARDFEPESTMKMTMSY